MRTGCRSCDTHGPERTDVDWLTVEFHRADHDTARAFEVMMQRTIRDLLPLCFPAGRGAP